MLLVNVYLYIIYFIFYILYIIYSFMYNIIDPYTQESFSLFSDKGKALLKKYIITYQIGGVKPRKPRKPKPIRNRKIKIDGPLGFRSGRNTRRPQTPSVMRGRRSDKEQDFLCHAYIRRFFLINDNGPTYNFIHQSLDTERQLDFILEIFNDIHNKFSLFTWQTYSSGTRVLLQTNGLRDYIKKHEKLILNPPELNDGNRKTYVEIIYTIIVGLHQLFKHPVAVERLKQQLYKLELAFKKLKQDGKLDKPIYSISLAYYPYAKSESGETIGIESAYRIDVCIMIKSIKQDWDGTLIQTYAEISKPMTIFQELLTKESREKHKDIKKQNYLISLKLDGLSFDYYKDADYLFSHSFMICSDEQKCQPPPKQHFDLNQLKVQSLESEQSDARSLESEQVNTGGIRLTFGGLGGPTDDFSDYFGF